MLVEKEVIRPGQYWYKDETTGAPRKLTVTPDLCRYWNEQGNAMLSAGLTVPVPYEHDFDSHPMTPKDKLLNNSGWVKGYSLKGDVLFSSVDVTDEAVAKKLPHTIRWTSPWINSFTDGAGREWKNVISHLALTTRPRIINQQPFGSIAAALSMASPIKDWDEAGAGGLCLSRAGLLGDDGMPKFPIAFSLMTGVALTTDAGGKEHDASGKFGAGGGKGAKKSSLTKRKKKVSGWGSSKLRKKANQLLREHRVKQREKRPGMFVANPTTGARMAVDDDDDTDDNEEFDEDEISDDDDADDDGLSDDLDLNTPGADADESGLPDAMEGDAGDVGMEELLCDLLGALGIQVEHTGGAEQFKRSLYNAAMTKIHELAGKGDANQDPMQGGNRTNPPGQPPNNPKPKPGQPGQPNPLIQQEQQPMFMSLDDIKKLDEPLKSVAMSMYNETKKANTRATEAEKVLNSLRDGELKKATAVRATRVALLGKLSPRAKSDLDAMLALPAMALSMGDGGAVLDPMATTLAVLEKGLADIPRLLTTDASAFAVQPQPTDADMLTEARVEEIADAFARQMGCAPVKKAS